MDFEDAVSILKAEVRDKCSAYADRALAEILPLVAKKFTYTNTCVMPLPELHECIYMAVSADSGEGAFQHDCEIVKRVYNFICQQQCNTNSTELLCEQLENIRGIMNLDTFNKEYVTSALNAVIAQLRAGD